MSEPEIVRTIDAEQLAQSAASRLAKLIVSAETEGRDFHLVLTGGGVGIRTLAALRDEALACGMKWSHVHLWWGDERFLPEGDPERNETQAREALIADIDIPAHQVHPMPSSDGTDHAEAERAATTYSQALAVAARGKGPVPEFDVCLLGLGPDAHVASLFPGLPGVHEDEAAVVAVHDSPKPPPTRISLTLCAIGTARQVWVLAAGESKAEAVRLGLSDASVDRAPVAGARGAERTVFWLDQAASAQL
ncbi:6-phosphogluconolactonase [Nocardiopsis alba]|uniref:6-phosphogluconolactonase n=2 Tax=Nocardiopsis alba TaxID=53437 RepID=A0A7K2IMK1_9ACTN|nr:6-phosphogluconolactonase [Nocardiopsis alba]AFR06910.1 6-phosphogluconolactonase [Nocardiopsis alba ATCC BAA-2165]MYR31086.1 6-phosphogluconolactonase [Nocardiopsis alba]